MNIPIVGDAAPRHQLLEAFPIDEANDAEDAQAADFAANGDMHFF